MILATRPEHTTLRGELFFMLFVFKEFQALGL